MMIKPEKNKRIEYIIHLLVWVVLFFLPYAFTVGLGRPWDELFRYFWFQIFLLAIIFYINYFLWVNRWFFTDKKWLFFAGNILLVAASVWLRHEVVEWDHSPEITAERIQNAPPFISIIYIDTLIYLIPVAFAIAIQSGKRLVKVEVLKQEADNIKLQSELQHLKYQLQPHFFFNSLNNIYALVDTEPEKAKQTIHSLSKLMRHLLQNSEEDKVTLSDEINFLKKYINLMALRLSADTRIETNFPGHVPAIQIAPLMFLSIVENAFKHGISATKPSWLYFEISVKDKVVIFISKNFNFPKDESDMSGSGIGIENLKKRLALLYENNHSLKIETNNNLFTVTLTLNTLN